jgi:hypothetical protein
MDSNEEVDLSFTPGKIIRKERTYDDDEFERLTKSYNEPIIVDSTYEPQPVNPPLKTTSKPLSNPWPKMLQGKVTTALPAPQEEDPYEDKYDNPKEDVDWKEIDEQRINDIIDNKMFKDEDLDTFTIRAEIVNCTVKLSKEQGSLLKDLINEIYPHTFPHYCTKVGISTPNFYNSVNGERPCSLEFLNKLLSGIGYVATMSSLEVLIQEVEIGEIVQDVNSISHENE